MRDRSIKLTINSELKHVALIGMAVNKIASDTELSQEMSDQMELCVVEAVNNAIQHAYRNKAGYEVEVMIEFTSTGMTFEVCDTGESMESLKTPTLEFDPDDRANLPEGGMGLYLIHQIMDAVRYERSGNKNILSMTKKFSDEDLPR